MRKVLSTYGVPFIDPRGLSGSMFMTVLLMSASMGVMAGANAESPAEIREDFDGASQIDWEEQEKPDNPAFPDKYEQAANEWDPGILPESVDREVQKRTRQFAEGMVAIAFWVAESAAMFGYQHQDIFTHWAGRLWLQLATYSAMLGIFGFHGRRVWRMWKGVTN